ncbi:serine--tRNA ligase [Candidatus Saccharibacteria bacterium]|nr:serine--tRNA ligase [Candidatus Saccharibacteria bacterium]
MIDFKIIRENPDLVKDSIRRRGLKVDIDRLLDLDQEWRNLKSELDQLRSFKLQGRPTQQELVDMQVLKTKRKQIEQRLALIESERKELWKEVPNLIAENTPDGAEDKNQVIKQSAVMTQPNKSQAELIDLEVWMEQQGLVDFERGAKVSGAKFYYQDTRMVKLWRAVSSLAIEVLEDKGFALLTVPHMVREVVAEGTGFLPKGQEEQNYRIIDQGLVMIATAEIPLTGYHMDETLNLDQPRLYAGLSPCYRLEAGAYGKYSKGLYRVHQFEKLEMYGYCKPDQAESVHQKILAIEEEIAELLELPYQVVLNATMDLGAPAYKKYDLEYYDPDSQTYRELTSCSNCTDYQARKLNIRFDDQGSLEFAYTLNGTAVTSSRTILAILANHRNQSGQVILPKALVKYYGKEEL